MNQIRVFIGSSNETSRVSEAVFSLLSKKFDIKIWKHQVFGISDYPLESLENEITNNDFAIFIASEDDLITSRGQNYSSMRDNVLFELGLFVGGLGRRRTFLLIPISKNFKIASDLHGLTLGYYDHSRISDDLGKNEMIVQKSCLEIEQAIIKSNKKAVVNTNYENELCNTLQDLFKLSNEFEDSNMITEIGATISEFLWKRGFYSTIEKIGNYIEDAASKDKQPELQAETLIEYLGWMKACKGELEEGKKLILLGINISKEINDEVLECKGYRHLAGIAFAEKKYDNCLLELQKAETTALSIKNEFLKKSQLAPTYYGFAELFIVLNELEQSKNFNNKSELLYKEINGKSSYVKLKAQKGKIYEKENDLFKAKNEYNAGLELSKKFKRNDELIRNLLGLSRVYYKLGNIDESNRCEQKANDLKKITPLVFL